MEVRLRASKVVVSRSLGLTAALLAAVTGLGFLISFLAENTTVETPAAASPDTPPPEPASEEPPPALPRTSVAAFFREGGTGKLVSRRVEVNQARSTAGQAKVALAALLAVPDEEGLATVLPEGTRVVGVFLDEHGEALVDLSSEAAAPAGVEDEFLGVAAIAATLAANFPAIERVRILLEGREVATLRGHVSLEYPFLVRDPAWSEVIDEGGAAESADAPSPDAGGKRDRPVEDWQPAPPVEPSRTPESLPGKGARGAGEAASPP